MLRKNLSLVVLASCFFLIAGCSGGGSITSPPVTTPGLTISSLSAFTATVGTTSAPQTVTLTNTGTATLTLTSVTMSSPSAFAMTSTCGTSLAPNATCSVTLTFTPTVVGTSSATITLTDNVTGSPQTVTLSGTGTAPSTPGPLSFSTLTAFNVNAGFTSTAQTLTVTNTGTAAVTFSTIALRGTNASAFNFAGNTCTGSLAPNASCAISLTLLASTGGNYSGSLIFTDNVAGSPQSVTLTGVGNGPSLTLSPGSLTFPATVVDVASATQSVAVTNVGTTALTNNGITVTNQTGTSFTQTNNCPASLAINTGCTIFVTFTPSATGTIFANVNIAGNAVGSPQSFSVSGTGVAPAATLGSSNLTFTSALNVTTAAQSVTLTNTGTSILNISGITLGGTNMINFALSPSSAPCGATLAVAAMCTISATFTPVAAAPYTATITIADDAPTSPQVITLNGTGTATSSVYRTLLVIPEADNTVTPLYNLINGAQATIDMTMYEMQDTTFLNDLVARCAAGVKVRVIFSQNIASSSSTAYNKLNTTTNCAAENSNSAFTNTHQKTITVDGATATATTAILSLNLQSQYYSTTRDFAIVTNDAADIAAIETTFNMDWTAGTPYQGTQGASDFGNQPPLGDDLVWSPYSTTDMLAIINNATTSLYIECEEFSAQNVISAIAAAATRGVKVVFICENESNTNTSNFATIKAAGANVWYYSSSTGFYIHAKTVVADLGLPTEAVYMGSINYSSASLTRNRELGVYITGNTTVSNPIAATIAATIVADETGSGVTKY